jgi:TM2 domain-containing membrane protein YozV
MEQKVWVINDQEWNRSTVKRGGDPPPAQPPQKEARPAPVAPPKSPAVAFSLAICFWGGGQLYLGRYRAGTALLAAMALFYGALAGLAFRPEALGRLAAVSGLPAPLLLAGTAACLLGGLILWQAAAVAAYYRTARQSAQPFLGVNNEAWPPLSALLFPGWGQFLNGQPKKGLCVQLLALPGLFALFLLLLARDAWPLLQPGQVRLAFEAGLAAGLITIPLTLLVWIVAAYDAFRSGRALYQRKLRLKNPAYRPGGWDLRRLIPSGSAILGLLLAVSLGMQFLPRQYYLESLAKFRGELLESHMEIVPEWIGKVIALIDQCG